MQYERQWVVLVNEIAWLYVVIVLAIPLIRVLPRIIRKIREGRPVSGARPSNTQNWNVQTTQEPAEPARHQSSDMLILGQMIAGAKTFESIQRYTGLSAEKLDSVLQDLESRQMIRVEHKQGILGSRVELRPTSKGLREFHN